MGWARAYDGPVFIKIKEVISSLKPWSHRAIFYVIVTYARDFKRGGFSTTIEKPTRKIVVAALPGIYVIVHDSKPLFIAHFLGVFPEEIHAIKLRKHSANEHRKGRRN